MLESYERLPILRLIQADRPNNRESFQTAVLYAAQVVFASALLMEGYHLYRSPAGLWAVISAALVVQPVMEQSIAASAVRIAANTVGGVCGILVGYFLGNGMWQFLLALVLVVFICDLLKLDLGLRTACVSVAVIMLRSEGHVLTTSRERLVAVVIGCVTALLVQLLAKAVQKKLGWRGPDMQPALAPAVTPVK
ncbi:MAG TPA: FUSC family protein [Tepidisphaeraceae bacterium]|jgi:uncharacterized membrane protein YccC|nr:FUSC family protein [Tepidisphaeraceae bacterium]